MLDAPGLSSFALVASPVAFAILAVLTRASWRRVLGAVTAAMGFVPVNIGLDLVADRAGLWHYPFSSRGYAPVEWYVAQELVYGAGFGLIGWRILRRSGPRGLALFLLALTLIGTVRDYRVAEITGILVFSQGPVAAIVDATAWAALGVWVQLIMWLVVGGARSDSLAACARAAGRS